MAAPRVKQEEFKAPPARGIGPLARSVRAKGDYKTPFFGTDQVREAILSYNDYDNSIFSNPQDLWRIIKLITQLAPADLTKKLGSPVIEAALKDLLYSDDNLIDRIIHPYPPTHDRRSNITRTILSFKGDRDQFYAFLRERYKETSEIAYTPQQEDEFLSSVARDAVLKYAHVFTSQEVRIDYAATAIYQLMIDGLRTLIYYDVLVDFPPPLDNPRSVPVRPSFQTDSDGDVVITSSTYDSRPLVASRPVVPPPVSDPLHAKLEPGTFAALPEPRQTINLTAGEAVVDAEVLRARLEDLRKYRDERVEIANYLNSDRGIKDAFPDPSTIKLPELVRRLTQLFAEARQTIGPLRQELKREIAQREVIVNAGRQLQQQLEQAQNAIRQERAQREAAEAETARSRLELQDARSKAALSAGRIGALEADVRSANGRADALDTQFGKVALVADQAKLLQGRFNELLQESKRDKATIAELERDIRQLQADKSKIDHDVVIYTGEARSAEARLKSLVEEAERRVVTAEDAAASIKRDADAKDAHIDALAKALADRKSVVVAGTPIFAPGNQEQEILINSRFHSALLDMCRDQVFSLAVVDILANKFKAYEPPGVSLDAILYAMTLRNEEIDDEAVRIARLAFVYDLVIVHAALRRETQWQQVVSANKPRESRGITYQFLICDKLKEWTYTYNAIIRKRQDHNPFLWWSQSEIFEKLQNNYTANGLDINKMDAVLRGVFALTNASTYLVIKILKGQKSRWFNVYRELCGVLWNATQFEANFSVLIDQPGGALVLTELMRWVRSSDQDTFDAEPLLKALQVALDEAFVKAVAGMIGARPEDKKAADVALRIAPASQDGGRLLDFGNGQRLYLAAPPTQPIAGLIESPEEPTALVALNIPV